MTNGEYMVSELIKKRQKLEDLQEEICEFEADLCGAEIEYKDYDYAIINYVDGDEVVIHCENESEDEEDQDDENQWEETITLEELLEIMSK